MAREKYALVEVFASQNRLFSEQFVTFDGESIDVVALANKALVRHYVAPWQRIKSTTGEVLNVYKLGCYLDLDCLIVQVVGWGVENQSGCLGTSTITYHGAYRRHR